MKLILILLFLTACADNDDLYSFEIKGVSYTECYRTPEKDDLQNVTYQCLRNSANLNNGDCEIYSIPAKEVLISSCDL